MGDIEVSPAKFHANQRLRWQEIRNGTKEADKLTNKKINNCIHAHTTVRRVVNNVTKDLLLHFDGNSKPAFVCGPNAGDVSIE